MTDPTRGTDRAGRRAKRFLTPLQKYEIFLQLVRQEVTMNEAAERWQVDRSTIMPHPRGGQGGRPGGAGQLPPRSAIQGARPRTGGGPGRRRPPGRGAQGDGRQADAGGGKRALGLSGRVPPASTRPPRQPCWTSWTGPSPPGGRSRGACRELELGEVRAHRWADRRAAGELEDRRPGGSPVHGLLDDEVAEIVALYEEWAEVDRSHRKLAHRGSYLDRVWVSPSSVRRVLAAQGLCLRPAAPARPVGAQAVPRLGGLPAQRRSGSTTPRISPAPAWP